MLCWSGFLFGLWQAIIHFHYSNRIRRVFAKLQFVVNYMLRNYEFWQKIERCDKKQQQQQEQRIYEEKKNNERKRNQLYTCARWIHFFFFLFGNTTDRFLLRLCLFASIFYNHSLTMCATQHQNRISTYQWIVRINYICAKKRERASERKKDERMSEWCTVESRCY